MGENLFDIPEVTGRDEALIAAYAASGRTLDDLPYTKEFEALFDAVKGEYASPAAAFRRLHTLRKAGKLPRANARGVSPAKVSEEDERLLISLVVRECGTLGQRDQLPLTPKFDVVAAEFLAATKRQMTPHDLWRLIARLAK
ncbi:MAG: hypothetical protein HEQ23_08405 [Tepidisphaera sp.]